MRKLAFILVLLGGCTTGGEPLSLEEQGFVACRAIPATVSSIIGFEPSPEVKGQMAIMMDTARPICDRIAEGIEPTTIEMVRAVRDELHKLMAIERELRD